MDRRSVLIGSGTAFAIALAGCTSGGDDDDGDEPTERTGSGGTGGDDTDDTGDGGDLEDVVDVDGLKDHTDRVRVREVKREGGTLVIELELTDHKKRDAVKDLGDGLKSSVKDVDRLLEKIDWLKVVLYDGGAKVASFKIDVAWLEKLLRDEIDPEDLAEHLDGMDDDD